MKWKPLFEIGEEKQKTINIVNYISNKIVENPNNDDSGLLMGTAGVSLFWQYLFKYNSNPIYNKFCYNSIHSSLNAITNQPLSHVFCSGISGILWGLCHLKDIGAINVDLEKVISEEIDTFIVENSISDLKTYNYDYLYGGAGIILYLLNRQDISISKIILEQIVLELKLCSEELDEGISWSKLIDGDKKYNLGLAHGIPSIIVLLSRLLEKGIAPNITRELLEKSISWLLAQKRTDWGSHSLFPNVISTVYPDENLSESRIGWCYGDLGIAITLIQAAKVTKNPEWEKMAIEIGLHAAKRRELKANSVGDAELCHGTAGIANIFNRLFHYTEIEEFGHAARYWYLQTINLFETQNSLKTWKKNEISGHEDWVEKYFLIDGLAGIGLSLLASISHEEPKWDRCFLLS